MKSDIITNKINNVPHQTRNVREQKSGKVGITFVVGVMSLPLFREIFGSRPCQALHGCQKRGPF